VFGNGTVTVTGRIPGPDSLFYTIDSLGCKASTSVGIVILPARNDIYIPNFFNPYSAKTDNQTFKVFGQNVTSLDLRVFSPWGALIYQTTDLNTIGIGAKGWDGKYNGEDMPSGVYVYTARITVTDVNNKVSVITKKGAVNLIR
jgi:gliding motility-associated-like protein